MGLPAAVTDPAQTDWLTVAQQIAQLEEAEPPRQGPRSVLLDVYRVQRLLSKVAAGNYRSTAAALADINRVTLWNLENSAKEGYGPAIAFVNALEKAESAAEAEMVDCVRGAAQRGPQYWAAGMTYLERRQPDKWGKRPDESSVPKVIVQIGTRQGDVQVNLGVSPAIPPKESETIQIQAINTTESDNSDYVNRAKLLTDGEMATPKRSESEGKRPRRRAIARGPQGRGRGLSRVKGVVTDKGPSD